MTRLTIATRSSALALAQARWVAARLEHAQPGLEVSLLEVSTTGDLDRVTPVATLTEVGAFVRSVQSAVLDGRADIAVHSCKDLPVQGPEGLTMIVPVREQPWDVLCGSTLDALADGARVGTGSPRRTAQLALLRPDLEITEIRGNVDTRLAKVASGAFDAVVLAEAGLSRLGRLEAVGERFGLDRMVPAPAQAALAVEVTEGGMAEDLVRSIADAGATLEVDTERLVLERTGAGCRAALGVLAVASGASITVTGFVADERGPRRAVAEGADPAQAAEAIIGELGL